MSRITRPASGALSEDEDLEFRYHVNDELR